MIEVSAIAIRTALKHVCNREGCDELLHGRQKFCSVKCRMAHVRAGRKTAVLPNPDLGSDNGGSEKVKADKNPVSIEISRAEPFSEETEQALVLDNAPSLEHYKANPSMYATRNNPEKLNWGKHMSFHDLQASVYVGNRYSVEGDWDFEEADE